MRAVTQSPTDPAFVQDPYPFYDRIRAMGPLVWWEDYGMAATTTLAATNAVLKDRRFGREAPAGFGEAPPERLRAFYDIEAHSMLEAEPPRHTRLRGQVLRAFTSRRIAAMEDEIGALCDRLLDAMAGEADLLDAYARVVPVVVIARLLGVPEAMAGQLLAWSNAMVGMYQARRTAADEDAAAAAAGAFAAYLRGYVAERRARPADDLITHLIAAGAEGARLSEDELVATCILLLNAGHEATVHTLGNAVKAAIEHGARDAFAGPGAEAAVEEALRHDPPLHMFTRWAREDAEVAGRRFRRGDRVACLLGAANRDPDAWAEPGAFRPGRGGPAHVAFGAGIHFCVGAPLARLELRVALARLFARHPGLRLAAPPRYADLYHFHGLEALRVVT